MFRDGCYKLKKSNQNKQHVVQDFDDSYHLKIFISVLPLPLHGKAKK
jgi:hypothetical protein